MSKTQEVSVDTIFETLESAAIKFVSVKDGTPTLFIDGADLLAKHEEVLLQRLISHAKRLANASVLCIVFVSSEGSILPLVQEMSVASRCAKIFEVTDIDDKRATEYLLKQGIPKEICLFKHVLWVLVGIIANTYVRMLYLSKMHI